MDFLLYYTFLFQCCTVWEKQGNVYLMYTDFLDTPVPNFGNKETAVYPKLSLIDEGFFIFIFSFYDASFGRKRVDQTD
jgi:hypothetical protein